MHFDRITVDPAICSGKPCIRGMRLPVVQVVDLVAAGTSFASILADYPFLEDEDIEQAVRYATRAASATIMAT